MRASEITDDSPSRSPEPGELRGERIFASGGRWLINRCWGDYVALMANRRVRHIRILKDPSGTLPAYVTNHQRIQIAFSRIADCIELGLGPFRIDGQHLRARIVGLGTGFERDALENVQRIRPGECIEIAPGASPHRPSATLAWTPYTFRGAADLIEDADEAAKAMRATVRACTHTWANRHERVLLRLSGGLDSSIVCGVLRDAPKDLLVTCYTVYNPHGRSDERPWARLAARHSGLTHVERAVAPESYPLHLLKQMPALCEPAPILAYLQRNTVDRELAGEYEATAVFTGDGGDSGFCSDSVSFAATEYAMLHGVRPHLLRLATQVASRTQRTVWTVLKSALGFAEHTRPFDQNEVCRLVAKERRESPAPASPFPHPWFSHLDHAPWALIPRLGTLLMTREPYDVAAPCVNVPEVIAPLYSQPVIELLLRIPIYRHFEEGRDRGLARRAFASDIPEQIRRRLWKDRVPGFFEKLIECQRSLLRETLLEGVLVKDGWLDRAAVENALGSSVARDGALAAEVFRHLDTEVWARHFRPHS